MRSLLALMMLFVLAVSGAAPACAQLPAQHGMAHHQPMPGHCDEGGVTHGDCLGCGVEVPTPPEVVQIVAIPSVLPPFASVTPSLVGAVYRQPLRPPQA